MIGAALLCAPGCGGDQPINASAGTTATIDDATSTGGVPADPTSESSGASSSTSSAGGDSSSSSSSGSNAAPAALDDLASVPFDAVLELDASQGLLANDSDPDGDALWVEEQTLRTWMGGTATVSADGAVEYTPPSDFGGCDGFEYTALDDRGGTSQAALHITVEHPQQRPSPVRVGSKDNAFDLRRLGGEAGARAGRSVAIVGDINADGLDDLAIGAPMWAPAGELNTGRAYVTLGGSIDDLSLGELLPDEGFALSGESTKAEAGYALAAAGDVNGDGVDDLLVGAWKTNLGGGPMGDVVGRTFVVWGGAALQSRSLGDLTAGGGGFAITGADMADFSGAAVSGGGDFDGDGLADVLIGAPMSSPNGMQSGRAYVVFGKSNTAEVPLVATEAGEQGFSVRGAAAGDHLGVAIANLGDFDGNGRADFAIGADGVDDSRGRVYVVFGETLDGPVDIETLGATSGLRFSGASAGERFGATLSGGGDFNGDGWPDLLIGAYGADDFRGRAYVALGGDASPPEEATAEGWIVIDCEQSSDYCGADVSFAGDLNADGFDDLLIGAWRATRDHENSGRVYVVFGRDAMTRIDLALVASGDGGFAIDGGAAGDFVGRSVGGGGDLDGDGTPDIVIGASGADGYAGEAVVVSGDAQIQCPLP